MEDNHSGEHSKKEPKKIRVFKDDPGVSKPERNIVPPVIDGNPTPGIYKDSSDVGMLYRNPERPRIDAGKLAIERGKNPSPEYHTTLFQPGDIIEMKEQSFEDQDEERRFSFLVVKPARRMVSSPRDFDQMEVQLLESSNLPTIDPEYAKPAYPVTVIGSSVSASMYHPHYITIGDPLELAIRPSGKEPLVVTTNPITEVTVKRKQGDTYREVPLEALSKFEPKEQSERFARMSRIYESITGLIEAEGPQELPNFDQDQYYQYDEKSIVLRGGNELTVLIDREKGEIASSITIYDRRTQSSFEIEKIKGKRQGEEIFHVRVYDGGITPDEGEWRDPLLSAHQWYDYFVSNGEDNGIVQYSMTKVQLDTLGLFGRYSLPSSFLIDPQKNIIERGEHKPEKIEEEAKLAQIKTRIEGDKFIIRYGEEESSITFPPDLSVLEKAINPSLEE